MVHRVLINHLARALIRIL